MYASVFVCMLIRKQWYVDYLENSDYGPEQGVEVLPVRYCVTGLCLETELTAKDVHPQDTTTQQQSIWWR